MVESNGLGVVGGGCDYSDYSVSPSPLTLDFGLGLDNYNLLFSDKILLLY